MKFKKAFAWILAVAMVITLMPSMAFANTTNSVSSTPTVAADGEIPETVLTLRVDDVGGWDPGTQSFRLTFENGVWTNEPDTTSNTAIAYTKDDGSKEDVLEVTAIDDDGITNITSNITGVQYISSSENSLDFSFTTNANIPKDAFIKLTFVDEAIKSGSDAGPLNIAIDGMDSKVTSRTITVANVGTSNTIASVTGTVKTLPRKEVSASELGTTIEIRETAVNSLKAGTFQSLRLTAPKGVSFDKTLSNWEFAGNLAIVDSSNGKPIIKKEKINDRIAEISFIVANNSDTDAVRNVLTIKPKITISRDTAEGDIAIQLVGGIVANDGTSVKATTNDNKISDASDLIIAKYGNEAVEVSTVEDIPTFISGYTQDTKGKNFTFKVTLKENMQKALAAGRYIDFELPDEVQICGNIKAKIGSNANQVIYDDFIEVGDNTGNGGDATKNMSTFSFIVPPVKGSMDVNGSGLWSDTKANTITFEVPVTVQADFAGDITCKVSGAKAGVEETELVVAKAESPITVTTQTTEVRNGLQTQAVADITITENYPGYLEDDQITATAPDGTVTVLTDNRLTVDIDTLGLPNGIAFENFESITVTDGDLELGKCTKNGKTISIPIKNSSTKASTIEIKGLVAAFNRTLPEGSYALRVYDGAVIRNNTYNNRGFADPSTAVGNSVGNVCAAKIADYVKIVTPADPTTVTNKINAVFTLRQDTFINNGETVQMDTAPYLDANNRTQLPIRYAAIACGVDEKDISWNQASQTATINAGNKVLRITIGSNIMQTSDGNVTMDTVAVSSNGRIFVPIRYIANALGANVAWDQDAKTITLTN